MVTAKDVVKIMDFGLAKLANRSRMTQLGTTLGTAAYMSPGQARGEEADNRADIWSLGVVLYEMISGQLPFKGDYEQAVIYSILNEGPEPLTALRSGVPIALDGIIAKALAKDPDTRYQHVDELPADLRALDSHIGGPARISASDKAPTTSLGRQKRWPLRGVTAGLISILLAIIIWQLATSPPEKRPVMRFTLTVSEGIGPEGVAISPDGNSLVYVSRALGGKSQIYWRSVAERDFEVLPGLEKYHCDQPFFSPDGEWLGFRANRKKLMKIELGARVPVTICEGVHVGGASWGSDGYIVFGTPEGLKRVSASGGTPATLTTLDSLGTQRHSLPQILPNARAVVFTIANPSSLSKYGVAVVSLDKNASSHTVLIEQGLRARYVRTGHLLYEHAGDLMAVPFDINRLELTGPPLTIIEGAGAGPITQSDVFGVSENGNLIHMIGLVADRRKLVWVDRSGNEQPLAAPERAYFDPNVSPAGQHLAVAIENKTSQNIWLYEFARHALTRLTFERKADMAPVWTPDGSRLFYSSSEPSRLFSKAADGSGIEDSLLSLPPRVWPISWSADGRTLALIHDGTNFDILFQRFAKTGDWVPEGELIPFLSTQFNELHPQFSPVDNLLAYTSDESGQPEVYVRALSGSGGKWPISTGGGVCPRWSRDGRALFYRKGDQMMAVTVQTQPVLAVDKPKLLFAGEYEYLGLALDYAVAPDNQRFLMIKKAEGTTSNQIYVVLNWFEELKQRTPN